MNFDLDSGIGHWCVQGYLQRGKPFLLDPLPYPNTKRIMLIWEETGSGRAIPVAFATFHGITERSNSFDAMAVLKPWQPTMVAADRPERFDGQRVSADFFRTLGAWPRFWGVILPPPTISFVDLT